MHRILALSFLFALALPLPGSASISLLGLKNSLVQFALEQISVPGELEITAEGVEEPEDGVTSLIGLAVADADGVWLRVESVALSWNASRILLGELEITSLVGTGVEVLRAPTGGAPEAKEDGEVEDEGFSLEWPRAPLTVRVDEMRLDRVAVAEGVIAGQSLAFDAKGRLVDEGDEQSLRFELTRTDAVAGDILLDYLRSFEANSFKLTLEAQEAAGGLVAELLSLPAESASTVNIAADGPLSNWRLDLDARTEGMLAASGGLVLDLEDAIEVDLRLAVTPEDALSPALRTALAPKAELALRVAEGEDGLVRVEEGRITSPALSATAEGTYERPTQTADLAVSLRGEPALAGLIEGLEFDGFGFEGNVTGTEGDLRAVGTLSLDALTTDPVDIREARLALTVEKVASRIGFDLAGDTLGLRLDRIGPDLLGDPRLVLTGGFEDGVLDLARLGLDGPLLTLDAAGRADTGAQQAAFDYSLTTPDLRPIAAAYDQDAAGRVAVSGRVEGPFDAVRLTGEAALEALSFQGDAFGRMALIHDVTAAPEPFGRAEMSASGSPYGPAEISTDFRVAGRTLSLSDMLVRALDVAVDGEVDVDLDTQLTEGSVVLDAPDLASLSDLAGTRITGRLGGRVDLAAAEGQQQVGLDLQGQGLAGFEATLDRLSVTGDVRDALGAAAADLAIEIAGVQHPEGALANGRIDAEGTNLGTAPAGQARFTLSDISVSAAEVQVATVGGTASIRDALGDPAADLALRVSDILHPQAAVASVEVDASATGLGSTAQAVADYRIGGIAAADAVIRSVTGRAEIADALGDPGGRVTALMADLDHPQATVKSVDLSADLATIVSSPGVALAFVVEEIEAAEAARVASIRGVAEGADLLDAPAGKAQIAIAEIDAAGVLIPRADLSGALIQAGDRANAEAVLTIPTARAEAATVRSIRLDAKAADALGRPVLDVALRTGAVSAEGASLSTVRADLDGPLSALEMSFSTDGQAAERPVSARMTAKADVAGEAPAIDITALRAAWGGAVAALNRVLQIRIAGEATTIQGLDLSIPGGGLTGDAALHGDGVAGDLRLAMPDLSALDVVAETPLAAGSLDLTAVFDTRAAGARADLDLTARELTFKDALAEIGAIAVDLDAGWDGRRATGEGALSGPFGDPFRLSAALPLRPSAGPVPTIPSGAEIDGALSWVGDVGELWVLVPAPDHVLDGMLDLDLRLQGPLDTPQFGGSVALAEGQYQNLETGTILTDLTVGSRLDGAGGIILNLNARDGAEGTVVAEVSLDPEDIDATATVREAVLVRRDDVRAQISADMTVAGPLAGPSVAGVVTIDRAELRLVNATPPSLADLGEVRIKGAPEPEPEEPAGTNVPLDIQIRAPGNVFIRGRGLDSEWQIALDVSNTAAAPEITGSVEKRRGQLEVLGRVFDLETGDVVFSGAAPPDPRVNVSLAHEREGFIGRIQVTGPASDPEIVFAGDPQVPEEEVLPRTLFNRSRQSLSPTEAIQLANAVATLLDGSGGTFDQVRGATGVDVLRLDDTGGGTAVTVGKNVSDGVFVGVKQPIDGGSASIEVEVDVFDDFTVDGEFGQDAGTAIGLGWRKDF
ncbi:MAG: translocation/assembly module TamB domain-containing protein [Pseudomonadota bacterium]